MAAVTLCKLWVPRGVRWCAGRPPCVFLGGGVLVVGWVFTCL